MIGIGTPIRYRSTDLMERPLLGVVEQLAFVQRRLGMAVPDR
jgi:hypothetical protein